ncbi:MAG: L,D-transpeptidase family protein [Flavobacteriales bacterium]|nr:L,D-transpeptidase family protein [Flavobacteriales bacterium]
MRNSSTLQFGLHGVLLLIAQACATASPKEPQGPTKEELVQDFETKEQYTTAHIDSAALYSFLKDDSVYVAYDSLIIDFYRHRDFQYAWFQGDTLSSAAQSFLDLSGSPGSGYGPWKVAHEELHQLIAALQDTLSSVDHSFVELSLTSEFFRFADKRYGGTVRNLKALDWYIPKAKKDYTRLLDSLVSGSRDLSAIEPVHPQYQGLKEWLRRYRSLELDSTWAPVYTDHKRFVPGDSAEAIGQVRTLLQKWGDVVDTTTSMRFDSALVQGVRQFRLRHGLKEVDAIDDAMVDVLNVPPDERVRQLLINMERLRWMPDQPKGEFLLVNIPAFRLYVYDKGRVSWTMNVVVGREATRTVIFNDSLSQVVLAPYWNIPQSIIHNEILPSVKRNAGYLDRKNMEVVIGGKVVPSRSIGWSKYSKGVPFTIRQKPGAGNALGRVKFLFPNAYSIYFHDTPSKGGFKEDQRAFSHGCIRLSEPLKLAEHLLRNDTTWTPQRIEKAADGKTETIVRVKPAIPVIIGYFTAWVDDAGRLNFRDDIYGHDERLARELFGDLAAGTSVQ